ncbi:GNAT family N-acetyltransferase [Bizionia argentinensis JUB59]|uniref:GNAT family N-acetyltransferase n=1 Tax=Bizionia argentinensis JUB59 TaxID=1046627 RepID=G2EG86_9FLAO|nr:GNAT family N-acetyltransferase [Bizionia argentinensis]EGV42593.1 GNAT family N-acetyltransferase [Bizionia argentinensis JUB59]
MVEIREAIIDDLPEITELFRNTILHINSKHYSEEQLNVWASGADNTKKWTARITKNYFIVAELDGIIVGFAYITQGYYLDGIYVHKDYKRQGIGAKLLRVIESQVIMAGFKEIKSDVYKTALPFFDDYYYDVEKKQLKHLKTETFDNYIIFKTL